MKLCCLFKSMFTLRGCESPDPIDLIPGSPQKPHLCPLVPLSGDPVPFSLG